MNRLDRSQTAALVAVVLTMASPSIVSALPPQQTINDSVDDALVELTVLDQHIRGDSRSWCQVRINVSGTAVRFTAGDTIYIWVYEDDTLLDDELFATSFVVSSAEVSAQLVDRTLDCASNFGSDASPTLELYASARVEKSECGAFCGWDRPETGLLNLAENDDDTSEDDDTAGTAMALPPGTPATRMAVDTDFYTVTLASPSIIELTAFYRPSSGRVTVDLLDSAESLLLSATDSGTGGSLTSAALGAGTYYVRVTPQAPPDSQFYDLLVSLSSTSCAGGASETRSCEMCGTERRTCEGSTWRPWGACMMQGECAAGAMGTQACGGGGVQTRTCSSTCAWGTYGACLGMRTDDDAGMGADGGVPTVDGGGPMSDGGVRFPDGSVADGSAADGSRVGGGPVDGGCSASPGTAPAPLLLLAFGALAIVRRWR